MYDNIEDNIEDNMVQIWKDNKGKYGVYRWINTLTGSSYVGSSTVINRRIKCYLETNYVKTYKHKSMIDIYDRLSYTKVWFKCIQVGDTWPLF
jgi:hypothetical protein